MLDEIIEKIVDKILKWQQNTSLLQRAFRSLIAFILIMIAFLVTYIEIMHEVNLWLN